MQKANEGLRFTSQAERDQSKTGTLDLVLRFSHEGNFPSGSTLGFEPSQVGDHDPLRIAFGAPVGAKTDIRSYASEGPASNAGEGPGIPTNDGQGAAMSSLRAPHGSRGLPLQIFASAEGIENFCGEDENQLDADQPLNKATCTDVNA